jgi:polysaccharide export outer membrane protein
MSFETVRNIAFCAVVGCFVSNVYTQEPAEQGQPAPTQYQLGPLDELQVRILNLDEYANGVTSSVDESGALDLPVVGRIQAGGRSVSEVETELAMMLKKYLVNPQVSIRITAYHSQPISVLGAVTTPGVLQVEAGKRLYEVISLAGGLKPEAGSVVKITRRKEFGPIPLPNAALDSSGTFYVAEVPVKSMTRALNPSNNIIVKPFDTISVPIAEVVYVVGAVSRPGSFPLGDGEALSVLQAVALANGLNHDAAPKRAKILRKSATTPDTRQIAVNIKEIISGNIPDITLGANDVLFIPNVTGAKGAFERALDLAAQAGTIGLAYHY